MATEAGTIHNCAKPVYISLDVDNAETVIRSANNTIVLFSECLMSEEELDYLCKAVNFYERYSKLTDGTKG